MRLPNVPTKRRPRSRFLADARVVRIRLWLAMLGLAVVPMVGTILIFNTLTPDEPPSARERYAWETAAGAADLAAAERDLEARLLAVAADNDVRRLVDGVDSEAERATVTKAISMMEMGDRGLIEGICLTRSLDGSQVLIDVPAGASSGTAACGSPELVSEALAAPPGGVVRATTYGSDRTRRLLIATEMLGTGRRTAGVLSAEVSLRDLFAAAPTAAGVGTSAVLVDRETNTIVAGARTDAVISGADIEGPRPLGNLRVRISGILSDHEGTARALEAAGWAATAAPLWESGDGAAFELIHLWPALSEAPADPVFAGFEQTAILPHKGPWVRAEPDAETRVLGRLIERSPAQPPEKGWRGRASDAPMLMGGKDGRALYFPMAIFELFWRYRLPDFRRMIGNAVRAVCELPVQVEAACPVEVCLMERPDGELLVGLVNHTAGVLRDHAPIPVGPVRIRFEGRTIATATSLQGTPCSVDPDDSTAVRLDRLATMDLVVISQGCMRPMR